MRELRLLDTSVVLELLEVPYESDRHEEARAYFEQLQSAGTEMQMPAAALVEAGAHVGRIRSGHFRRSCAARLARMIESTINRTAPWSFSPLEWDEHFLRELVDPGEGSGLRLTDSLTDQYLEMGDLLIVGEFRRVRSNLNPKAVRVDVWTYDGGLRAAVDELL